MSKTFDCSILKVFAILFAFIPLQSLHAETPSGFHRQFLKETGGAVNVPDGWYFKVGTQNESIVWTFSKEDPQVGYLTGLRIQLATLNKDGQPERVALKTIASKKETAKVIQDCVPVVEGLFTKRCLETEEKLTINGRTTDFHILTTFSWSNELGYLVVVIAGAPLELWPQYEPIFEQMRSIKLIDTKYLESQALEQLRAETALTTIAYNHVSGPSLSEMDRKVHQIYDSRLNVIDLRDTSGKFHEVKLLQGGRSQPMLENGLEIRGKVVVVYVVSANGNVIMPEIYDSTDARLNDEAIKAVSLSKFEPATFNGKNIAIVAGQEIQF